MQRIRKSHLLALLLLPFAGYADGQDGLVVIWDGFLFLVVFGIWAAIVFPALRMLRTKGKKLSLLRRILLTVGTGLLALFIWLMVKTDPYPYDGPIDSIIHGKEQEALRQRTLDEINNGHPDSTIEETIAAIDTSEVGIFIWLKGQRHFVRKNSPEFETQQQKDSMTMAIVRSWKDQPH